MSLDFIWWCNECEQEVLLPEEHVQMYPTHTYAERMRWSGDTITPILSNTVKNFVDEEVSTVSGTLQGGINDAQVFGSNYFFTHNEKIISTTDLKYKKVLGLDFNIDTLGKYRVSCFHQYRYYGYNGVGFKSRIKYDDTVIFENVNSSFYLKNESDFIPISFFDYIDMEIGLHSLLLEMSLITPKGVIGRGSAGYIKDMKLELWRIE